MRKKLPPEADFYISYNQMLASMLDRVEERGSSEEMVDYMKNAVDYLMNSATKPCLIQALQTYKNILASPTITRYFAYCD